MSQQKIMEKTVAEPSEHALLAIAARAVRRAQPIFAKNEQTHSSQTNSNIDYAIELVETFCRRGVTRGCGIKAYSGNSANIKKLSDLVIELLALRGTLCPYLDKDVDKNEAMELRNKFPEKCKKIIEDSHLLVELEYTNELATQFERNVMSDMEKWSVSQINTGYCDPRETGLFGSLQMSELPLDYKNDFEVLRQQFTCVKEEESRLIAASKSRVNPEHIAEEYMRYFESISYERTPNPCRHVKKFVEEAYDASLQVEEGRATRFQLVYRERGVHNATCFAEAKPYTNYELVKLAPTVGLGFRQLVVSPNLADDSLEIVGISDDRLEDDGRTDVSRWRPGYEKSTDVTAVDLKLRVLAPGHLQLQDGGIWELKNGIQSYFQPIVSVSYLREWICSAARKIGVGGDAYGTAIALIEVSISRIISTMISESHGGAIILQSSGSDSGLNIKYQLDSGLLLNAITARTEAQASLPGTGICYDSDSLEVAIYCDKALARSNDFVSALTAVDGATVIDRDLIVSGFGAEIDYDSNVAKRVPCVAFFPGATRGETQVGFRNLNDFGMRHRSAYGYCKQNPLDMVIVVSQDGGVKIFCTDPETSEVIVFQNVSPIRKTFATIKNSL